MPQTNFELINHAYSFSYSVTHSGGETYSLPQSDYGAYGEHLDAFFNSMSAKDKGSLSNLVAWYVSDMSLTAYLEFNTSKITNEMSARFPINSETTGKGIVDLRTSPEWKYVIGDGIVANTLLSSTDATNDYTEGVKTVFEAIRDSFPNIEWTISGLPHLPFFMTYAPDIGLSGVFGPAGHSPTFDYNQWDSDHPVGRYDLFYTWSTAPNILKDYYKNLCMSGMQKTILDECQPDWICVDARVPNKRDYAFNKYTYIHDDGYIRNKTLNEIAANYAKQNMVKSYAELSTIYPSRELNEYDDPSRTGNSYEIHFKYKPDVDFLNSNLTISSYSVSGGFNDFGIDRGNQTVQYISGFTGGIKTLDLIEIRGKQHLSALRSGESYYPVDVFQYEMVQAAADGGCFGFLFCDPAPQIIKLATTDSPRNIAETSRSLVDVGSISTGYPSHDSKIIPEYIVRARSRNMFSYIMFGQSDFDDYKPQGGWSGNSWMNNELRRYASNQTKGMLDRIKETVQIGRFDLTPSNGWERTLPSPPDKQATYPEQTSTNTPESDSIYGEQKWYRLGGPDPCGTDCDPDPPTTSPPQTDPETDTVGDDVISSECRPIICQYEGDGGSQPPDSTTIDPKYPVCCFDSCQYSECPPPGTDEGWCLSCQVVGGIQGMVEGSDYYKILQESNVYRVQGKDFILSRKANIDSITNWKGRLTNFYSSPWYRKRASLGRITPNENMAVDSRYARYAVNSYASPDYIKKWMFGIDVS